MTYQKSGFYMRGRRFSTLAIIFILFVDAFVVTTIVVIAFFFFILAFIFVSIARFSFKCFLAIVFN
jgi:hypothetical protein